MVTAVINSLPIRDARLVGADRRSAADQLRPDTVLWRYLDAAKLFDFFENSTLFFCRKIRGQSTF